MKRSINTMTTASRRLVSPALGLPTLSISVESVGLKARCSTSTTASQNASFGLYTPLRFSNYQRNFSTFESSTHHIPNTHVAKNTETPSKNSPDSLLSKTRADDERIPSKESYAQTNGLPYTRMFLHDVETSMYLYKFGTPESASVRDMRRKSFELSGNRAKNIMEPELCSYLTWQARQIRATRVLELGTYTSFRYFLGTGKYCRLRTL